MQILKTSFQTDGNIDLWHVKTHSKLHRSQARCKRRQASGTRLTRRPALPWGVDSRLSGCFLEGPSPPTSNSLLKCSMTVGCFELKPPLCVTGAFTITCKPYITWVTT